MRSPLPGAGVALGLQSGGLDRLSAGVFFDVVPHVAPSVRCGTGGWVWSQPLEEPFNARAYPPAFAGAFALVGMCFCIYLLSSLGL